MIVKERVNHPKEQGCRNIVSSLQRKRRTRSHSISTSRGKYKILTEKLKVRRIAYDVRRLGGDRCTGHCHQPESQLWSVGPHLFKYLPEALSNVLYAMTFVDCCKCAMKSSDSLNFRLSLAVSLGSILVLLVYWRGVSIP